MKPHEEDPSVVWYAAGAASLLIMFVIVVIWAGLRSIGVTFNCGAILGGLLLLALVFVAIRPFVRSRK